MRMGSRADSRADKRISTLDGELRACKSEHVLRGHSLAQKGGGGESVQKHSEDLCVMFGSQDEVVAMWKSCWLLISRTDFCLILP